MEGKYPDQTVFFASWNRPRDVKALSDLLIGQSFIHFDPPPTLISPIVVGYPLIGIAKRNTHAPELNVLVVGMPNVGKSTLLNALRNKGIAGRKYWLIFCLLRMSNLTFQFLCFSALLATPKALRTSAQPGLTRALSTRLKLSVDPLVSSYDSPGVMLPFLGNGDKGAERGVKLALIGANLFFAI